jgi:hypothetical protein
MNRTASREVDMNSFEIDCPWCAGEARVQADGQAAVLDCATCSIVVGLADDPSVGSIAKAA